MKNIKNKIGILFVIITLFSCEQINAAQNDQGFFESYLYLEEDSNEAEWNNGGEYSPEVLFNGSLSTDSSNGQVTYKKEYSRVTGFTTLKKIISNKVVATKTSQKSWPYSLKNAAIGLGIGTALGLGSIYYETLQEESKPKEKQIFTQVAPTQVAPTQVESAQTESTQNEQQPINHSYVHHVHTHHNADDFNIMQYALPATLGLGALATQIWPGLLEQSPPLKSSQYSIENGEIYLPDDPATTLQFKDVAGLSQAKREMQTILDFLKNPEKFKKFKTGIPKGILLCGGPGNGKTLLAKSLAGESNLPFISVSGASFNVSYRGTGAERIVNLFKTAQTLANKYGACIVFIDEIDAFAAKRSSESGGSISLDQVNTVTALLTAMDGADKKPTDKPIIVIAATNRVDALDDAVKRAGRFDIQIEVTKPTYEDRIELLNIGLKDIPHSHVIQNKINHIAKETADFSGAQLAELLKDAGRIAINENHNEIEISDINKGLNHIKHSRGKKYINIIM